MSRKISVLVWLTLSLLYTTKLYAAPFSEETYSAADTSQINESLLQAKALLARQPDMAREILQQAYLDSKQRQYPEGRMQSKILEGTLDLRHSQYGEALTSFEQALDIASKLADVQSQGRIYNNMAIIYRRQGHYPNALQLYLKALAAFEDLKDDFRSGHVLTNIANVYADNKRYEEAIAYHMRALSIMEKLEMPKESGAILNNLGNAYYETNDRVRAMEAYNEALTIRKKLQDSRGTAITLHNIGNLYCDKEDYANGLASYAEAIRLASEIQDVYGISTYSVSMANALTTINEMDSARAYLDNSLDLAMKIGALATEMEARQTLARIDSAEGNFQEAFVHYQRYAALKDSLFSLDKERQIIRLQSEYEVKSQQKENLALKNEVALWKKVALFLYLGGMVLFAVLLAYRVWRRKQTRRATDPAAHTESKEENITEGDNPASTPEKEEELLRQKQELSSLHLQMLRQNETLDAIRSRLTRKPDAQSGVAVSSPTLREVAQELDKVIKAEDSWQSFSVHFESIHTGFFDRLKAKFPCLTQNDHKLCAYLRLNLTTKEIAGLMNVSPSAVQKSRQRLRKKMSLEAECDLTLILTNI